MAFIKIKKIKGAKKERHRSIINILLYFYICMVFLHRINASFNPLLITSRTTILFSFIHCFEQALNFTKQRHKITTFSCISANNCINTVWVYTFHFQLFKLGTLSIYVSLFQPRLVSFLYNNV